MKKSTLLIFLTTSCGLYGMENKKNDNPFQEQQGFVALAEKQRPIEALKGQVLDLVARHENLKKTIQKQSLENDQLKKDNHALLAKNTALNYTIQEQQQVHINLFNEQLRVNKNNNSLKQQLKNTRKQKNAIKRENCRLNDDYQYLKQDYKKLKRNNKDLENDYKDLEESSVHKNALEDTKKWLIYYKSITYRQRDGYSVLLEQLKKHKNVLDVDSLIELIRLTNDKRKQHEKEMRKYMNKNKKNRIKYSKDFKKNLEQDLIKEINQYKPANTEPEEGEIVENSNSETINSNSNDNSINIHLKRKQEEKDDTNTPTNNFKKVKIEKK